MNVELLTQDTLCIDYEKYTAWPNFKAVDSNRIGGLWRAHFLRHALTAEDLSCAAWRAPIPTEILRLVQDYVDCHAELLEMAQAVPDIFVRWAKWNPAFTLLAATYWTYRSASRVPDIETRKSYWENLDPRDILQHTRCDASKSFLRALGKIAPGHCYDYVVSRLREQWQIPEKRRLLRHLQKITMETTWLLGCFPPFLDPGLHRLASDEPYFDEFHLGHIVADLSNRREIRGIFREGAEMKNCSASYVRLVAQGTHYLYRLLRPERATVLFIRRPEDWYPIQAKSYENGAVQESTLRALHTFAGTLPIELENTDDFPF